MSALSISDNADRARHGLDVVAEVAFRTGVAEEDPDTAISDVLAYIAHACDALGIEPRAMFDAGFESYLGDREDGPFCLPTLADAETFAVAHERGLFVTVPDDDH